MQKDYETPNMELINMTEDIITSSGLTNGGTGDGDSGNFEDMFKGEW